MKRLLLRLFFPGLLCLPWSLRAAAPRPNIGFFLIDDLGWSDVGVHGGEIKTPNIAAKNPDRVKELRARLDAFAREAVPPKAHAQPEDFKVPRVWGQAD